ncbi:MAG: nucleotide exchange factor GrpE [Planctomycetes bacterium]|nr:nucleotide exchange factor GrpE [Planctomycetota bacterium]
MKKTDKSNPKKQAKPKSNGLEIFYDLLDLLLPQNKEFLQKVLEEKEKQLKSLKQEEKDKSKYTIEVQKEVNSFLEGYAKTFYTQYQRLSADYANFQKRVPKQVSDTVGYEKEKIIKSLLPVLDNFEHTLQIAHTAENIEVVIKGIRIVYDQMLDILKSYDVSQIKALGEKFDPALHQAMMQREEADEEEDVVLEEFQKGYRLNGRVLRPSKVVVNKQAEKEKPQEAE